MVKWNRPLYDVSDQVFQTMPLNAVVRRVGMYTVGWTRVGPAGGPRLSRPARRLGQVQGGGEVKREVRPRFGAMLARRPHVVDVVVAAAATGAAVWVMAMSREIGAVGPDLVGAGLLVLAGVGLVLRRRFPAAVLLGVTALTMMYLVFDYAGGAELPLLLVAVYTCIAEGRRWVGVAVTVYIVGSSAGYRLLVDGDDPLIVIATISLVALVAALGEVVHAHRRLRAEVAERVRLARAEQALEADAARSRERLELARELHDVLAHTITAVTVQSAAAADGLEPDSDAHAVFRSMRTTAQDAMRQLQTTIAVLRDGLPSELPGPAAPSLKDIELLAAGVQDAGLTIDLDLPSQPQPLTSATAMTAYRILQESLTNVLRHAQADHVHVRLAEEVGELVVEVVDDGTGGPAEPGRGFGLTGMRERTQALGGVFAAGQRESGGFAVMARLPLEATGP